ncbi:class I SAM-dependent methyltransferase [Glycomyces arizonensis]|uniref:class I SAM-dependent methyltransferase n=1 Tax=Glycomyces arizonensis TaxID=256035 RepID=UPI00041C715E|nr:class I SAM-dependent methyltransferase [Glycomyces arizonensis]
MTGFEFPGQYYEVIRKSFRDVDAETAYFSTWLEKSGRASGGRVLDLGCGTGTNLRALRERGHTGVGVDTSAAFLERASALGGDGVDYVRAAITEFDTAETFDLVVCVFATLNLIPPEQLAPLLRRIRGWLKPGGHLVLEAAHLLGFVDAYQPYMIAHHEADGVLLTRLVRTTVNGHTACWRNEETIVARDPDGTVSMHANRFDQWVLTAPQIRDALTASGFAVVAEHGGFRDAPPAPIGKGPLVQVAA